MSEVVVVTPRAGPLIELSLVKAYLRVEHGDHDVLIAAHVEAAASWLDGPSGWLGRSLAAQTLRLDLASRPAGCGGVELPCGPVRSIEAITYLASDGVTEATVDPAVYELKANRVRLRAGQAWPTDAGGRLGETSIEYVAGHATLPPPIQAAVLMHVRILYDQPIDKDLAALERSRDDLLSPWRIWRV